MEDADLIKMKPAVREKRVTKKSFIPPPSDSLPPPPFEKSKSFHKNGVIFPEEICGERVYFQK